MICISNALEQLESNPVVAAVSKEEMLNDAIISPATVVFLLYGDILSIADTVKKLRDNNKKVFIHVDLVEGLGRDLKSVDYIAKNVKADGIISTHRDFIKHGHDIGLETIQRIFLIDSLSFVRGIKQVNKSKPDFIEVMPGIIPSAISKLKKSVSVPIIAGGMIACKEDIINCLHAGAVAVSTSMKSLWSV